MQKAIDTSYVIPPVDKNLILEELKSATFLKKRIMPTARYMLQTPTAHLQS